MASNSEETKENSEIVETLIKTYEIQEEKLQRINEKIDKKSNQRGLNTEEEWEKV